MGFKAMLNSHIFREKIPHFIGSPLGTLYISILALNSHLKLSTVFFIITIMALPLNPLWYAGLMKG